MAIKLKSLFSGFFSSTSKPSRDEDGFIPITSMLGASPQFNDYGATSLKLQAIFNNPALLKVFCLQCDLFSLGKIVIKKDGKQIEDPFSALINQPNPFQGRSQLLWDFMFWTMLGTSYCYVDSTIVKPDNKIYFLDPSKIDWPESIKKAQDKFVFSNSTMNNLQSLNIKYRFDDGTSSPYPISKIIITTDLSNGTGNWFKGASRIDALHKIISNSEAALDAENINIRYSGKFLVAGTQDPSDTTKQPLSPEDKKTLEERVNGRKQVHAFKSMIDIKRFVSDLRSMDLGKHYLEAYYLIGSMYNIPKDVLEAYQTGATYENQEKATAKHVSYTLQPKGNDFMQSLANYFGYSKEGKTITIEWDHLPFMQVFEKDKAVTKQLQVQSLTGMLKLGVPVDEINEFLGTNFKNVKYEAGKQPGA